MRTLLLLFLSSALLSATTGAQQRFTDPAPPTVTQLQPAKAPDPSPHAALTFHRAPKPLPQGAATHDWTSFLGPSFNAVSTETKVLASFPPGGPAKVWEVAKGEGYSAPAIAGDRLVLFHRIANQEIIDCLHRESGQRFWTHRYPTKYRDRYGYNNGPRCAPVTDGHLLYTYGAEGKLHCLELSSGRVIWKRDLLTEFKISANFFGVGATPLLENNLLIINVGADNGPSVAAFNKNTGKLVWGAGERWGASYASPVPADIHGKRRILVFAGGESRPATGGLLCIDPASGGVDFSFPWRGRRYESVNASNPVVVGSRVFLSECYGAGSVMVEISPEMQAKELWTNEDFGTHFMTAIHKDGYLYGFHGHGPLDSPLVCLDARTGKEIWRHEPEFEETVPTPDGPAKRRLNLARASLLHLPGENKTLCLGEYGHLLYLDLNPAGYKELSRAWLFAGFETWTAPVLSRGLLYVCQNSEDPITKTPMRLICYDLRSDH